MASVVMESKFLTNSPIDNYPEYDITEYIYCDKCGSFSIQEFRTFTTWLKGTIGLILAILGGEAVVKLVRMNISTSFQGLLACINCSILIFIVCDLLMTWAIMVKESSHRCLECGNTEITEHGNVLDYPAEDKSVLDVPDYWAHKHRNRL